MGLFPSRRWRTRLLLAAGLVALVTAYLVVAVPTDAPASVRDPVQSIRDPLVETVRAVGQEPLTYGLAFLGGTYAVLRLGRGRDRPAVAPTFSGEDRPTHPKEAPTVDEDLRDDLDRVARWIDDPEYGGVEFRSRLREDAIAVVHATSAGDREAAERAVETGTWTDDHIAAAFLGGEPAPGYPFRNRLRGWLRPDLAFEVRFERTVDALYERRLEDK
jgi:hypothetical protein